MIITTTTPFSNAQAPGAIDMLLAASVFYQQLSLVFMAHGVYQLLSKQHPETIAKTPFTEILKALDYYDIDRCYVEAHSLTACGLCKTDLLCPVTLISAQELGKLANQQDLVLHF